MIRRPPRSTRTDTLFPYTTLFRSQPEHGRRLLRGAQGTRPAGAADPPREVRFLEIALPWRSNSCHIRQRVASCHPEHLVASAALLPSSSRPPCPAKPDSSDRKSTRMNSSH